MSALMILEIEAGSTSMWMILALGANSEGVLVMRSSNLAPIAIIRSALCIAIFAWYVPCIPSIPMKYLLFAGYEPSPIRVLVTGTFKILFRAINSL